MIRAGQGDPLVLLHGVTCSERVWRRVLPLLAPYHDTVAFSALGHVGGTAGVGRASIAAVVDDAERQLDALGFRQAHLAGNSMGGWVAIELARRGRAKTVCALSPAGCWEAGAADQHGATDRLRRVVRRTRATRPLLPLLARSGTVRHHALADNARHGERVSPAELADLADDLLGCSVRDDLLGTTEELAPLDPLPCRVVLAWSARDRIFPPAVNGRRARELMPAAEYRELPDVGHLPMLDDPQLVATTILETTGADSG